MTASLRQHRPLVVVGGLDPGGQAGLAADLQVAWASGVPVRPVVAARTAQTDQQWLGSWAASADEFDATLGAAGGLEPLACKSGMLGSCDNAGRLARWLQAWPQVPLVVDPLAYSSSGGWMWGGESPDTVRETLRSGLLQRATVATPNWLEVAWWSGAEVAADPAALAQQASAWPCALLIKGGHAPPAWIGRDWLWDGLHLQQLPVRPPWPEDLQLRGTGCRLATALAIALGQGLPLAKACTEAVAWLDRWARATLAAR